jgi:hypothetical protein
MQCHNTRRFMCSANVGLTHCSLKTKFLKINVAKKHENGLSNGFFVCDRSRSHTNRNWSENVSLAMCNVTVYRVWRFVLLGSRKHCHAWQRGCGGGGMVKVRCEQLQIRQCLTLTRVWSQGQVWHHSKGKRKTPTYNLLSRLDNSQQQNTNITPNHTTAAIELCDNGTGGGVGLEKQLPRVTWLWARTSWTFCLLLVVGESNYMTVVVPTVFIGTSKQSSASVNLVSMQRLVVISLNALVRSLVWNVPFQKHSHEGELGSASSWRKWVTGVCNAQARFLKVWWSRKSKTWRGFKFFSFSFLLSHSLASPPSFTPPFTSISLFDLDFLRYVDRNL